jgi:hypothetical protein
MPVADLPAYRQIFMVGGDRLLKPPHLPQRRAQVVQHYALAESVAGLPEDRRGVLSSCLMMAVDV